VAPAGQQRRRQVDLNNNVCGLYRPFGGAVRFEGRDITGRALDAHRRRRPGAGARGPSACFPTCPVRDNLELGSYRRGRAAPRNLEHAVAIFPAPQGALDAGRRHPVGRRAGRCWRSAAA
jgi:branched-chain amino acid transport system ATP-binding protein